MNGWPLDGNRSGRRATSWPTLRCAGPAGARWWGSMLSLALVACPALASPEGDQRWSQIVAAYQQLNTYRARMAYTVQEQRGRWHIIKQTSFELAVDRTAGRLMFNKPSVHLVIDGDTLRLRSDQFKPRYLQIDTPDPLTFSSLAEALPFLKQPEYTDLMLLLGQDPCQVLFDYLEVPAAQHPPVEVEALPPDPDDPRQDQGLVFRSPLVNLVLRLDTASGLLTLAVADLNPAVLRRPATDMVQLVNEIEVLQHNVELPESTFAFETIGARRVSTLAELAGHHKLDGQPAAPIELGAIDGTRFVLADVPTPIVLVHFWATWYPDRRRELAALQEVQAWVTASMKPVTLVAVNLKDSPEKVQRELQKVKLEVTVLLASDNQVAQQLAESYDAVQLPRTVLIAQGRIARVFASIADEQQTLRQEVDMLLNRQGTTKSP